MDESKKEAIQRKLESYVDYSVWLAASKAASRGEEEPDAPICIDEMMRELTSTKNFVLSLPNCNEKLLLYYRYIRGMNMENIAELFGVSTRSVYRMRVRALDFAAKIYFESG